MKNTTYCSPCPDHRRHHAAFRTDERVTMKKLWVILLAGCALVISQGFREVAADQGYTPLEQLAGTYSETVRGSYFLCLAHAEPSPPANCGSPGSTGVPINALAVGASTFNAEGNGCVTWTETDSDSPVDASPPTVFVVHQTAQTTNYDPTTGTGDGNFTNYFGGKCNGSTFDSTNATVASTGTYHFVVTERGKRVESIVTSLTTPGGAIGDFSISGTALRE
jgi:hypothetical protein